MGKECVPFDPWHTWWHSSPFAVSMIAGGVAGLTVDIALFPIDTLKTRNQARAGLCSSGGYSRLYQGLGAAALGSAPCSALFFVTYEGTKRRLVEGGASGGWATCAAAAAAGEAVTSLLRTPTEIVKQRMQVGQHARLSDALRSLHSGGFGGAAAFRVTAARDIPFSVLQYPMYDWCKRRLQTWRGHDGESLPVWQAALVGAFTGSISALLTTPIDVCKTRRMLGGAAGSSVRADMAEIWRREGMRGLFSGGTARATWMGLGGLLFLGSYEQTKAVLDAKSAEVRRHRQQMERMEAVAAAA